MDDEFDGVDWDHDYYWDPHKEDNPRYIEDRPRVNSGFIFCPYCGVAPPSAHVVEWVPRKALRGSDFFFCQCGSGHSWRVPINYYAKQLTPILPGWFTATYPSEERLKRDASSLVAIVCPVCGLGRLGGSHIVDAVAVFNNTSKTLVTCECDNAHRWELRVQFGDRDKEVPVKSEFFARDFLDKNGIPKPPEYDLDAILREVQLIIEGKDELDE